MRVSISLARIGVLCTGLWFAAATMAEEYVCPIGGSTFVMDLDTGQPASGQNFDFKPYGEGVVTPRPFPVCPDNGFIMYRDDFSDEELALLEGYVTSEEFQSMRTTDSDYYRLAKLLEFQGEPLLKVAFTMLQASWEVDTSPERYRDYASAAVRLFETYAEEGDPKTNDYLTSHVILAELHRRLRHFQAAAVALDRVKHHDEATKPYPSRMILRLYELISLEDDQPAPLP